MLYSFTYYFSRVDVSLDARLSDWRSVSSTVWSPLWKAWPKMLHWALYMKIWQINGGTERGLPPLLVIIAMSDTREQISIWNVLGQHSTWIMEWNNPEEFRERIVEIRREEMWEKTQRGADYMNVARHRKKRTFWNHKAANKWSSKYRQTDCGTVKDCYDIKATSVVYLVVSWEKDRWLEEKNVTV